MVFGMKKKRNCVQIPFLLKVKYHGFCMKKKRNCVQIPFLLNVKRHGFWYEKEKELCPNPLSS